MDGILFTLLLTAVSLIKLGQGFAFDHQLIFKQQNRFMIFKGVLVGVFLVPILFLLCILLFKPIFAVMAGVIVMAISPAGDMSVEQVGNLGGDVPVAAGIQVISGLITIFTVPIFLYLFNSVLGTHVEIKFWLLIQTVAISQSVPIIVGITLRRFFFSYDWLAKIIVKLAKALLILTFIVIFIESYQHFFEFRLMGYIAGIFVTVCAFILGVIFAGKNSKSQISLAIEASLRNPGLAYLIAIENFSVEKTNTALVPYLFTTILTVVFCTIALKQIQKFFVN